MTRTSARLVTLLLGVAATAIGCGGGSSSPPGQLVVVFDTDLSVPKDLDAIGFEVVQDGTSTFSKTFNVGEHDVKLPATITLVTGSHPRPTILVRVLGLRSGAPRMLREALVTVPSDRIAMLRLPLQWLSDGSVSASASGDDPANKLGVHGTCGDGSTNIAGTCADVHVDSSRLPDYSTANLYGVTDAENATAFDVASCFADSTVVTPDGSCVVTTEFRDEFSVALQLPPGGDGFCDTGSCYVPIDLDDGTGTGTGWTDDGQGAVYLPAGVCSKIAGGSDVKVVVSDACGTKAAVTPACGPASSVPACDLTPAATSPGAANGRAPMPLGVVRL